ncbi:response regulator [Vibrio sp. MA40-2]|uniref:response regulator n=1 Tax=Vibrio sp. MA40-2 TaxID=3391828 RepID=UPI0039A6A6AC
MINILIIEDEIEIASLHAYFIKRLSHFKVSGMVWNLNEAREYLKNNSVDLILIDNYLPDGLGIDFISELQCETHCILVTAANDTESITKANKSGAFDYVVKPVDYHRLEKGLLDFYAYHEKLANSDYFRQDEIDKLLFDGVRRKRDTSIDPFLLTMIVELFPHTHVEHTVESIAKLVSVSKTTARRYLDKAVDDEELIAFLVHGKVGRPTRIYRRPTLAEKT